MSHLVIGLVGPKGIGKSTVARGIASMTGATVLGPSEPIHAMLTCFYETTATGLSGAQIRERVTGSLKEEPCPFLGGKTPREAMQALGTEWGRETLSENLWLDAWNRRCRARAAVVNDSVRFPNEAEAIKEAGGVLVRLTMRDGYTPDLFDNHSSERFDFDVDHVVHIGALGPHEVARRVLSLCGISWLDTRLSRGSATPEPMTASAS